jgi:MFS-type transporter involved in bile tolerance (Atg22 family)
MVKVNDTRMIAIITLMVAVCTVVSYYISNTEPEFETEKFIGLLVVSIGLICGGVYAYCKSKNNELLTSSFYGTGTI